MTRMILVNLPVTVLGSASYGLAAITSLQGTRQKAASAT